MPEQQEFRVSKSAVLAVLLERVAAGGRPLVTAFPQTDARMIPATDRLYRAVVEKRLTVPDHEELRQQAANTIMRNSRRGARLDKPSLDLPNDSIVALSMALEALENQPEPVQVVGWL